MEQIVRGGRFRHVGLSMPVPSGCKLDGNPCEGGSTSPAGNAPYAPGKPTA